MFWFYTEIQDGGQKWWEKDFWEESSVDSADTLWVKNFIKIALSCSVSEINEFLRFTQKFKLVTKSGGKTFFCKKSSVDSADTLWVKNFVEIALSRSISEINAFLQIHLKIFDIYFCHYFPTNKKIAHLWHAIEPQNIWHLIVKYKVTEQHILGKI